MATRAFTALLVFCLLPPGGWCFLPSSFRRGLFYPLHATSPKSADKLSGRTSSSTTSNPWPFPLPPELTGWLSSLGAPTPSTPTMKGGVKQKRKGEAEELKKLIKRMVAPTNRGFSVNTTQRVELMKEIVKLEALNEIEEPVFAPEVSVVWSVLYAAPINETISQKAKELAYVYGPVLSRLKDLIPKGIIQAKGEFQIIDGAKGSLTNIATFTVLDKYQGRFEIDGTAEPVPPRRFNVAFTDARLSLGSWLVSCSLRPLNPTGWVDVTYLDDDFRLTRGDKGSIFVVSRVRSTPEGM